MKNSEFSDLVGLTLRAVTGAVGEDVMEFIEAVEGGRRFRLHHYQSCCENVSIEDIAGDLQDLVGSPILFAEESTSTENPADIVVPEYQDSFTWTFYRIGTVKGTVVVRWYGSSNGYYGESVDFQEAA